MTDPAAGRLFSITEPLALPLGLTTAIESGSCVLFVGAGVGANATDANGAATPNAVELARELADQFDIEAAADSDLATVAQIVELRKGRLELEAFLAERLANLTPDENLQWLLNLPWRAIFTTNYDSVIERAYELTANPRQNPVSISASAELVALDPRLEMPVYHLHGYLFGQGTPRILITQDDYALFREKRRMLFDVLKQHYATSPILYIGYSHKDPNWATVQAELRAEFAPSQPPHSYRVVPETAPLDKEILRSRGIEALDASVLQFAVALRAAVGDVELDRLNMSTLETQVPSDLSPALELNPAALARLLRGWSYVNQAPFHETPNTDAFLRGDQPNWGLVGAGIQFERDVEEPVIEAVLDFITATDARPRAFAVLGSAGYGVSTALRAIGVRLAKEGAGPVYLHRPGLPLNEGDILFASEIAKPFRPVFVIDNAADEGERLPLVMQRLRDSDATACLLVGERTNEWRQARVRLSPHEFGIEPLSDAEIERLLDCLERNDALGQLEALDAGLRRVAIREKHEKQLLVAMREATEGRAFDAIIEDEYRSIASEFGRRVYATVCGVYRLGIHIRDMVLAEVVACPAADLYDRLGAQTEGVVTFDELDVATGSWGARARHQTIAEIVWERGVGAGEAEELLLQTLDGLNLNFYVDLRAFEAMIRSDATVERVSSLEGKTRFFEAAARKDPTSPYVRQHYARMLLREGKADLALAQIEQALRLDDSSRSLHHTKGVVLREMAFATDSVELGRRRLAQSEAVFQANLNRDSKDDYSYQSLAELYLRWSQRVVNADEALAYLTKATETVNEGLKFARNREGLYIVFSRIQEELGDKPAVRDALERAVAVAPGGVISRYLLGRELRRRGQPEQAVEILRPIVEGHPQEVLPILQYGLALDDLQKPYAESIAVLRLASLYGRRVSRYVATLGGMLFLNGDFTEASEVFADAENRDFTYEERSRVEYVARERGGKRSPLRLTGAIVSVKAGYAFLRSHGYPDVFFPKSRLAGEALRPGMAVTFEVGFTVRGPVGREVTIEEGSSN